MLRAPRPIATLSRHSTNHSLSILRNFSTGGRGASASSSAAMSSALAPSGTSDALITVWLNDPEPAWWNHTADSRIPAIVLSWTTARPPVKTLIPNCDVKSVLADTRAVE
jgi:hypothetical protein